MLTFDPEIHEYRWNGIVKTSVTQFLERVGVYNPATGRWQSMSGAEFMDNPVAQNFGTQFHRYAGLTLDGRKARPDPAMVPWIEQWNLFLLEHPGLESVMHDGKRLVETPLYCKRHGYALTPDWPVMFHGKPVCLDWKTGEYCPHWFLQGAGYVRGLEDTTKIRGWSFWAVQIKADGYRVYKRTPAELKHDMNRFMSVLNVYKMAA